MKRVAIAFSGPSNNGKTTLICKVAKKFIDDGLKVAIVKHDPKDKAKFDTHGKDSFKFSTLGAEVVVTSPTRTTYFSQNQMEISKIIKMVDEFDILIVEGLKTLPLPRISLFLDNIDESYIGVSNAIASNLSDEKMAKFNLPFFDINDTIGVCEWILQNAKEV